MKRKTSKTVLKIPQKGITPALNFGNFGAFIWTNCLYTEGHRVVVPRDQGEVHNGDVSMPMLSILRGHEV